jgi:thiamine transport system substrate-binding protein
MSPLIRAIPLLATLLVSAHARAEPELVIYTYDSFVAEGGLGPAILPLFEKRCGCKVKALGSGDGGQLLSRIQLDARASGPRAHLVLGLDQLGWARAKPWLEEWGSWRPRGWEKIETAARGDPGFLPFDYGVFALMSDTKKLSKEPKSLADLRSPELKRSVILEDPRTSTPGLAFLLFTSDALGEGVWDFWKSFRSQWLTLAPGWDAAYGLFLKGEAPLVWSYVTSQAYHVEHGEKSRYRALVFDEGNPAQVEGAAIIKGSLRTEREKKLAREFLEFLLSPEAQAEVPRRNWMYPSVKGTKLPESYASLPRPKKTLPLKGDEARISALLKSWGRVVQGGEP